MSLKKNIIFNGIRVLMQIIFPLISFPYASRVLLADGIGKVNFTTSVIAYFVLFASLGISTYGVRNGSQLRDDHDKFSIFVQELFSFNLITTIVTYAVFLAVAYFSDGLLSYRILLFIGSLNIIATPLGMEWLYGAEEDYSYITKRSIAFQFISLILLFVFVKSPADVNKYAFITVFSSVGSNVLNLLHSRRYVSWKFYGFKRYNLKRHIKPVMIIFGLNVACNIYMNMDKTMLGLLKNDREVGLYTAAYKINTILLSFVNSIGAVLLPRMSYHLSKGEKETYKKLLEKSFNYILLIAIPAVCGLIFLAEPIILLLSGESYLEAVPAMQVLSIIILISGMGTTLSTQYFVAQGKEKVCLISSCCAAVTNFFINLAFIPKWGSLGAAIATVACEIVALCVLLCFMKKETKLTPFFHKLASYLLATFCMIPFLIIINHMVSLHVLKIGLAVIIGVGVYFVILLLLKNEYLMGFLEELKIKKKNRGQ